MSESIDHLVPARDKYQSFAVEDLRAWARRLLPADAEEYIHHVHPMTWEGSKSRYVEAVAQWKPR